MQVKSTDQLLNNSIYLNAAALTQQEAFPAVSSTMKFHFFIGKLIKCESAHIHDPFTILNILEKS